MSDLSSADELFEQAAAARRLGEYATAERLQRQGLGVCTSQDLNFSVALENLAGIHFIQEKFDLAATEYERALKIHETFVPQSDPGVLRLLYWLAESYFKGQKYNEAETVMRRNLFLAEAHHASPETLARSLYHLGFLLYFVGRYQEAEPYLLNSLPIFESAKGAADPETVQVLERIALNYKCCPAIGKDAEPYFKKAIEVIRPEGEMRRQYMENLCRCAEYVAEGHRFEEADALFSQLLMLIDLSAEPIDIDSSWVRSACAKYFQSRGKSDLAAHLDAAHQSFDVYGEMVKKQLERTQRTLSDDDPALAEALFNSANHAFYVENYEEAETLFARALGAYTKIEGDQGESVVRVLGRTCILCRLLKKFDAAEAAIQRATEIAQRLYVDRYVLPSSLESFAHLREAERRIIEATDLWQRAAAEYERICGFPSYDASEALYRHCGFLFRTKDLSSAEAKIRQVISAMDEIETLSDYEKSDYVNTLASILEATGRQEEAVETRKRAEELFQRAEKQAQQERDQA